MRERNFFHRSSTQTVREPRVVNDLATADVDSVMQIAATRCDKVRAQRRFLVTGQEPIGTLYPGTGRTLTFRDLGVMDVSSAEPSRDNKVIVGLLHGSITRFWAMGDERRGSTGSVSLE